MKRPFVLAILLGLAPHLAVAGDIRVDGKLISTAPAGVPPLEVGSEALVENLNADLLDGAEASSFAAAEHAHPLDPPPLVTVPVDCGAGDSVNEALETPARELIVEISGLCGELVLVRRGQVTLRGTDPATDGIRPPVGATDYFALVQIDYSNLDRYLTSPGVRLENLSIANSAQHGLASWYSDVELVNCRVEDNASMGARSTTSSVEILDSVITGNDVGARARSGGVLWVQRSQFLDNTSVGVFAILGSTIVMSDSDVSGSQHAVWASGSSVASVESSTLSASGTAALSQSSSMGISNSTLAASVMATSKGSLDLGGETVQTAVTPPFPGSGTGNHVWHDGYLLLGGTTTLLGPTLVAYWGKVYLADGTTLDGDLECFMDNAEVWCDGTNQVTGSVIGCAECQPTPGPQHPRPPWLPRGDNWPSRLRR